MTRDVALCQESDHLADVSELMKQLHLKSIPVVDSDNRPIGVLTARVILRALLGDAKYEESQLINYVDGLGYR
jgi:CBS domain-containing protein